MKAEITALVTDNIKRDLSDRFALDFESVKMLDGFENIVYEAERQGRSCILRLSHSTHRERAQVESELHWVDYLATNGASVCTPIHSREGNLTEPVDATDGEFVAALFERAPGKLLKRPDWTDRMTFNRGKLLGMMHRLTRDYQPPAHHARRPQWFEDDDFANYDRYLSPEDAIVGERFAELQNVLKAVPHDHDSYGLIHMDAHQGNIHFDGDEVTLFDFDDCLYDYFFADLAISLFYAVPRDAKDIDREAYARGFLTALCEGYRTEYQLDNRWLELFPMMLKRREILLYIALHRGYDPTKFDDDTKEYLRSRRVLIVDRTPYLNLDWSEFSLS